MKKISRITLDLPLDVKNKLKAKAARANMSMADVLRVLVNDHLQKDSKKRKEEAR